VSRRNHVLGTGRDELYLRSKQQGSTVNVRGTHAGEVESAARRAHRSFTSRFSSSDTLIPPIIPFEQGIGFRSGPD
jgi:hypothetical protein